MDKREREKFHFYFGLVLALSYFADSSEANAGKSHSADRSAEMR